MLCSIPSVSTGDLKHWQSKQALDCENLLVTRRQYTVQEPSQKCVNVHLAYCNNNKQILRNTYSRELHYSPQHIAEGRTTIKYYSEYGSCAQKISGSTPLKSWARRRSSSALSLIARISSTLCDCLPERLSPRLLFSLVRWLHIHRLTTTLTLRRPDPRPSAFCRV